MNLKRKRKKENGFNPIAFGLWKDRKDTKDSIKWVKTLRKKWSFRGN
jgi:hypothetical protein